jgi:hypothetical protein
LQQHWLNLAEITVWIYGNRRRWYVILDPRRAVLTLEASGANEQDCREQLDSMRDALQLEEAAAGDPYRYRGASASYRIRDWDRKKFAEGVDRLVQDLSAGGNPPVRGAYVAIDQDDKTERLIGFHNVSSFLDFLKKDITPFHRLGFAVEGAAGEHLGLSVDVKELTMEVRTGRPPERLRELISPLESRLDLKLIEGRRRGSSTSDALAAPAEPWWVKHMVAVAVASLAAVVASATVGLEIVRALNADYEVKLSPPLLEKTELRTTDGKLNIDWYLKPTNTLFQDYAYGSDARAALRIQKEGTTSIEHDPQAPPIKLQLDLGTYVVEIRPVRPAEPKWFTVLVDSPAKQ